MPAARSRSSPIPARACSSALRRRRAAVCGLRGAARLGHLQAEDRADELLLGAVVEIARQTRPRGVGGLDDAPPRGAQLGGAGVGDVALAHGALGREVVLDVGERGHRPAPAGEVEGRRRVGDRQDRAVLAHEPVLVHLVGLAGQPGVRHRAVLGRVRAAVGVLVVDGVVAGLADQLGGVVVAQRPHGRRVGVAEHAVLVDDPDRLGDLGEDRVALAQGLLGLALPGHVDERRDDPASRRQVDRHGGERDREQRAVAADEPVLVAVHGHAGARRLEDRALRGRERRAVRVLVMDRVVPVAALELGGVVVAQRPHRRRVGEHDGALVIDDPDRKGHALEGRAEEAVASGDLRRGLRSLAIPSSLCCAGPAILPVARRAQPVAVAVRCCCGLTPRRRLNAALSANGLL